MMKLKRVTACLLGLFAVAAALPVYLTYVYMLGFPDGFVTGLEETERNLAYLFIAASFAFGAGFIYLGAAAKNIGKNLSILTIVYLIFAAVVYLADCYFRSTAASAAG